MEFVRFLMKIGLLLAISRFLGESLARRGQSSMVGCILAGLILGESFLGIVGPSRELDIIARLGSFFLVLMIALEIEPRELFRHGLRPFIIAFLGFLTSFLGGFLAGLYLERDIMTSLFIGVVLSASALPVALFVIESYDLLKLEASRIAITSAIITEILMITLLGAILEAHAVGSVNIRNILLGTKNILAFLLAILSIDYILSYRNYHIARILRREIEIVLARMKTREFPFALFLITGIFLAVAAERAGLSYVIGAFLTGLLVYEDVVGREALQEVKRILSAFVYGFFAPLFFSYSGVLLDLGSILDSLPEFLLLLLVAFSAKILGAYLGGRIAGLEDREALFISHVLNLRGTLDLVILYLGLDIGIIDERLFSILVAIVLLSMLLTPFMISRDSVSLRGREDAG